MIVSEKHLSEEEKRQMADLLGVRELPKPHYADLPQTQNIGVSGLNWTKGCSLADPVLSQYVMRFTPAKVFIDTSIDPYTHTPGMSFGFAVARVGDIPVNDKITNATGIGAENTLFNRTLMLWRQILWTYGEMGACAMSKPIAFEMAGDGTIPPMMGVFFKLVRKPKDGQTIESMKASVGVLVAPEVETENRVMPLGVLDNTSTIDPEDN